MGDKDYNDASTGNSGAGQLSKDDIGLVTPKNKGDEGATDKNVAKEFTGAKGAPTDTKKTAPEGAKDAADKFEGNKGGIEGQKRETRKEGSAGATSKYMDEVRGKIRDALGLPKGINDTNKGLNESTRKKLREDQYDDFNDGSPVSIDSLEDDLAIHITYDDGRGGGKDYLPFKVGHLKRAKKDKKLKEKINKILSKENKETHVIISQSSGSQIAGDEETLWSGTIGDLISYINE